MGCCRTQAFSVALSQVNRHDLLPVAYVQRGADYRRHGGQLASPAGSGARRAACVSPGCQPWVMLGGCHRPVRARPVRSSAAGDRQERIRSDPQPQVTDKSVSGRYRGLKRPARAYPVGSAASSDRQERIRPAPRPRATGKAAAGRFRGLERPARPRLAGSTTSSDRQGRGWPVPRPRATGKDGSGSSGCVHRRHRRLAALALSRRTCHNALVTS